ncbi:MAG: hypothetical protein IKS31_09570 [Clostridia bacterium]|nr:hypothetical protein [Clostridia bacterium]
MLFPVYACCSAQNGIDLAAIHIGHSDIRVTMNTYVNLHDDGFDEMYAALSN